jgi:secreted trypsin-like serine protease
LLDRNPAAPVPGTQFRTLGFGFGTPADPESFSNRLFEAVVSAGTEAECTELFDLVGVSVPDRPAMVCAGWCTGDEGAPLVNEATGTAVGIASMALAPCGGIQAYTKISSIAPWVDRYLRVWAPEVLGLTRTTSRKPTTKRRKTTKRKMTTKRR